MKKARKISSNSHIFHQSYPFARFFRKIVKKSIISTDFSIDSRNLYEFIGQVFQKDSVQRLRDVSKKKIMVSPLTNRKK